MSMYKNDTTLASRPEQYIVKETVDCMASLSKSWEEGMVLRRCTNDGLEGPGLCRLAGCVSPSTSLGHSVKRLCSQLGSTYTGSPHSSWPQITQLALLPLLLHEFRLPIYGFPRSGIKYLAITRGPRIGPFYVPEKYGVMQNSTMQDVLYSFMYKWCNIQGMYSIKWGTIIPEIRAAKGRAYTLL